MTKNSNIASKRKLTCEDRIRSHLEGRLADFQLLYETTPQDVELVDDGTMDTVLRVGEYVFRYSHEFAADYRDESGALDLESFIEDVCGEIEDSMQQYASEYGLDLSWDQDLHCLTYLLSTGGPHDEIRYYYAADGCLTGIKYAFLDWFDGAVLEIEPGTDEYNLLSHPVEWVDLEQLQHMIGA